MKVAALLFLSLILSCSVARPSPKPLTPPQPAEVMKDPEPPKSVVIPGEPVLIDVPKIVFDAEVNDDSARQVVGLIQQVDSTNPTAIVLELNTPGGSVPAGQRISKAIEEARAPVYCVVDGEASSMGFYILQSCSKRLATRRSMLLAHEASVTGNMSGKEENWRSVADMLRVLDAAMRWHCCHRFLKPSKCEANMTGRDWWMTPGEALKLGALDAVISDERPWLAHLRSTGQP